MIGLALCQLLSCTWSGYFIDTYGRKFLLIRGQFSLIMILLTIFLIDSFSDYFRKDIYHYLLVSLFYIHVVVFNFSIGPIALLYAA